MAKDKWIKVGEVGVDSGMLMVCDPCYIDSQWKTSPQDLNLNQEPTHEFSYEGCCLNTLDGKLGGEMNYEKGHAGAGVSFCSGLGDGKYTVEARVGEVEDWGMRVKEIRMVLINENKIARTGTSKGGK